jgi:5-methyltetrahydrofolate--homocysteine methyltransferase
MPDYALMNQCLYEGKAADVKRMTEEALAEGITAEAVLEDGLIAGMSVVGEDFKHNRLYVPQVLVAARAMKAGMAVLRPLLAETGVARQRGTLVMGTVKGDLHDIGKNLVCMMAEGAGFKVVDIGIDQPAQNYVRAAREHGAQIVGMSALLTTTMTYMKTVIDAFREEGLDHVRLCVGGAPVSRMFAEEIGADGYAPDASSAVELFESFCGARAEAGASS